MNYRTVKKYLIAAAIFFSGAVACAQNFVEFIILDKVWPDHKWGHVSLRVKTDSQDMVFDFGRYGKMWGSFNTEGEPILRVWKNATDKHTAFQKVGNPVIHTVRFEATPKQTDAILEYYAAWTKGITSYQGDANLKYYNLGTPAFHSLNHNCTTLSIAAFAKGFPQYDLNNSRFAQADGLYWWARGKATNIDYDASHRRWAYVWWPKDLLNALNELALKPGMATEKLL